jgi:hypothetical protein
MPVHIPYATSHRREQKNLFGFIVGIFIVPLLMLGVSVAAAIQNPEFAAMLAAFD